MSAGKLRSPAIIKSSNLLPGSDGDGKVASGDASKAAEAFRRLAQLSFESPQEATHIGTSGTCAAFVRVLDDCIAADHSFDPSVTSLPVLDNGMLMVGNTCWNSWEAHDCVIRSQVRPPLPLIKFPLSTRLQVPAEYPLIGSQCHLRAALVLRALRVRATAAEKWRAALDPASGRLFYVDGETGARTWSAPPPCGEADRSKTRMNFVLLRRAINVLFNLSTCEDSRPSLLRLQEVLEDLTWIASLNAEKIGDIDQWAPASAAVAVANLCGKEEGTLMPPAAMGHVALSLHATVGRRPYGVLTYKSWQLAMGVANLAVSDVNKPILVRLGVVPDLLRALDDPDKDARSQEQASRALLNICLCDEGARALQGDGSALLRRVAEAGGAGDFSDTAARHARSIVFHLAHKNMNKDAGASAEGGAAAAAAAGGERGQHVMLSYNWGVQQADGSFDNQEKVKRIAETLKQHGFTVWLDIEQARPVLGSWAVFKLPSRTRMRHAAC